MPELLLDDVAAVELEDIALELDDETPSSAAPIEAEGARTDSDVSQTTEPLIAEATGSETSGVATPTLPPQRQLSKFRQAPATASEVVQPGPSVAGAAPGAQDGGAALGRIPLVRVRRGGARRVPFLARLLSSF